MGYWLLAAAAVSLLSNYSSSQSDAATTRKNAAANASALLKAGKVNADSIMALGQMNMQIGLGLGRMESDLIQMKSKYNAGIKSMIGEYNAILLEEDARLVWEKADLDISQIEDRYAEAEGKLQVGFGASGVIMNQDSALDAVIDLRTKKALDSFIVSRGADIEAGKILDAAARSTWEGNLAAQQIIMEGKLGSFGAYGSRYLNAIGAGVQAVINANSTIYNSEVAAWQTLTTGQASSTNQQNQATSNLISGLFSAYASSYSSNLSNTAVTSNYSYNMDSYQGIGALDYSASTSYNSSVNPWYGSYVRQNRSTNNYTKSLLD